MKLSYFTNLNAVDGGGVNADRLCRAFDTTDGIDLTAVHAQGTDAPETFWTDELGYAACYPRSFADGLDATDPDIVFVHGYNPAMLDWLGEHAPEDDRIYVFRNGVNTVEQWLNLYNYGDPERVTAILDRLDVFDAVFAPSHAAAERLQMNYGDDCPHLSVAPCVIDYPTYSPTPFMETGTLRVVTASRLAPNNYVLAPLLAVRRLVDDIDIDMEILSAGDRPYAEAVRAVADSIDDVRIVGHLPADEVQQHLEWADVVCVPSAAQQAVPTVAVEAMAAGNVVLAAGFHTVGEADPLITVPLDHPPAWHDALTDVAESPDEANAIIRDGMDHAAAYDVDHVVQNAYQPMFAMLLERYG